MNEVYAGGGVAPHGARESGRGPFDAKARPRRWRFDLFFGLVLPALCFAADPVVFRGWLLGGRGFYGRFQFYVYSVGAMELLALAAWLFPSLLGRRRPAVLAGVLLAGGVFSFGLGLLILPLSLLGLLVVVGVLGFTPFVTGVVYLRNGLRAAAQCRTEGALRAGTTAAIAFGFVFALGAPLAARVSMRHVLEAALADVRGGRQVPRAKARLMRAASAVAGPSSSDGMVWEYSSEPDPVRRARLAKAYAELTGEQIEERLAVLSD
ncbi:MAG TPA: hypothetical protein VF736_18325 [Pyrinomonadaceae bacterium]|jgi:hypothetical protein